MYNVLIVLIFIVLFTAMFLVIRYCKKKSLKIGLGVFIGLLTVYMIMFSIDFNRTSTLREPIFARENGYMGSMTRYDGLGYKIGLEKNGNTGYISQSQMTMFGIFVVRAVTNINDNLKLTGTADYLFNLKIQYIGDNSDVGKLLDALDIREYGDYTFELKTDKKPYALIINYSVIEDKDNILGDHKTLIEKSAILLALIENADEIHWVLSDNNEIYKITTSDLNDNYGNIKSYSESVDSLRLLLVKLGYYEAKEGNLISMVVSNLSNKGLILKLINNSSNDFLYGDPYTLQRQKNGEWINVEQIKDNCAFNMIGYILKSNQTLEKRYNWSVCYGKLPKGKYRINKDFVPILSEHKSEFEFGKKNIISAEFMIHT